LNKSRYWLGNEAAERGIVGNRQTVFRFLRGERDTSTAVASGLFEILGLEILAKRRQKGQGKCN